MDSRMSASLDRYLTTPPDDGFDEFCELVIDKIDAETYVKYDKIIDEGTGIVNSVLNKLFKGHNDYTLQECADIVVRAIKIYRRNG